MRRQSPAALPTWDSLAERTRQPERLAGALRGREGRAVRSDRRGLSGPLGGQPRDCSTRTEKVPVHRARTRAGRRPALGTWLFPPWDPLGQVRGVQRRQQRLDLPGTRGECACCRLLLCPRPPISPELSAPPVTFTMSRRRRRWVLASPTLSPTSRAGQPRPGAPAWARRGSGQPGALMAAARVSGAQGFGIPDARFPAPWATSLGGSEFSCPGRRGGAHGCPLQKWGALLAPSLAPEAHAWVSRIPPPPLPFPGLSVRPYVGAAGDGAQGEGFPSASSGFPTLRGPQFCPPPRQPLQGSAASASGLG